MSVITHRENEESVNMHMSRPCVN